MSDQQSSDPTGDQAPLILEKRFTSELQIDCPSPGTPRPSGQPHGSVPQVRLSAAEEPSEEKQGQRREVVLSTQSAAAKRLGTQQLIPKNLAVASRSRPRHHTTVVTLPVRLEAQRQRPASEAPDVAWDDYDSDGEGRSLRRNGRNKSYRAAVTTLDMDAIGQRAQQQLPTFAASTLAPVAEGRVSSPGRIRSAGTARSPGRKRTLGRIRNPKQRGSFKDDPRLYQEIRERGLQSTAQNDELLDDFLPVESNESDQSIVVKNYRPAQVTWSQLPQVLELGILETITAEERKRQEAIFEIITSEYSYLHSLTILVRQFKGSEALRNTMTMTEYHHLFSNISVIQGVSKSFFEDLEKRHHENPFIEDISDIVQQHATHNFKPYIVYCSNETYQQRTLQKLLASNTAFKEVLKQIESSMECGGLPMISFLILPMQRVTRLPLLLDTICQKTPKTKAEHYAAVWALKAISKLVHACNDGARKMERTEQMCTIQNQLEFGKNKNFPLVSVSRWLKKRGELGVCPEELSIFWKAFGHKSYYLFLFNDVLIVTRKKSEESYVVIYYANPENVEVEAVDMGEQTSPSKQAGVLHLSLRLIMKKSDGRQEHIALVAESKLDRARWMTALQEHQHSTNLKASKGLPQYEVTKGYMPKEPDELGLQLAEVVIVLQKVEDWYHGERMRDGERGWFPASCAKEITSRLTMECNVQRMERLRKETNV